MAFLEFVTQNFPTNIHFLELSKAGKVVDSMLSQILLYLSSSNQVCIANASKKKYSTLFTTPGASQDSTDEPSIAKFLLQSLTFFTKLFPLTSENGEQTLSDYLVNEKQTMDKLLTCLNMCRGESFELLEIGMNIVSGDLSEVEGLEKPNSIEDGIMKVFCLLYKHAQQRPAIMESISKFFSTGLHLRHDETQEDSYYHISELFLWILLKLLDSDENFQLFCENGTSFDFTLVFINKVFML